MFSIIVAFDKNQLIGKDNKMPWHYPEDLRYFKEITLNKKVVMGNNTFQSILTYIHKPLPQRENIVISRNHSYDSVECFTSVDDFINKYKTSKEEIFIIGGKSIYEQMIDKVERLYITHINKEYSGDTYFPHFNYLDFKLISEKVIDELNFCVYERKVKNHD